MLRYLYLYRHSLMRYILISFFLSGFYFTSKAQNIPLETNIQESGIVYLNYFLNRIMTGNMDSFNIKLVDLKRSGKGRVTVVHIGDSHIQPDLFSSVIRNNLQDFFGDAGRGLVFPHRLARSNSPDDVSASSSATWNYNRLVHPEKQIYAGITGFVLQTTDFPAYINISLKPNKRGNQYFDLVKIFAIPAWHPLGIGLLPTPANDSNGVSIFRFEKPVNNLSMVTAYSGKQQFYGVSLEKNAPGLLWHTIGVNGARYEHYNNNKLFWEQLRHLKADLIIVSLGTNEAQNDQFNETDFYGQVDRFIEYSRNSCPGVSILITTPQDSYRFGRSNENIYRVSNSLTNYCIRKNIPLWDLYRITNGYGSASNWYKKRLLGQDRIHFTAMGYRIQGRLLFNALAQEYNRYVNINQNLR